MNEGELGGNWTTLEPSAAQRRRIEARVRRWLDAHETSLAAEWFGLLKVNPLGRLIYAAVAAVLVLVATPLSWMALAAL
jgi:hypothetical protein